MAVKAKCDMCPGEVMVGMYDQIRVPAVDDEGFPIYVKGELQRVTLRLPKHASNLPSEFVGQRRSA